MKSKSTNVELESALCGFSIASYAVYPMMAKMDPEVYTELKPVLEAEAQKALGENKFMIDEMHEKCPELFALSPEILETSVLLAEFNAEQLVDHRYADGMIEEMRSLGLPIDTLIAEQQFKNDPSLPPSGMDSLREKNAAIRDMFRKIDRESAAYQVLAGYMTKEHSRLIGQSMSDDNRISRSAKAQIVPFSLAIAAMVSKSYDELSFIGEGTVREEDFAVQKKMILEAVNLSARGIELSQDKDREDDPSTIVFSIQKNNMPPGGFLVAVSEIPPEGDPRVIASGSIALDGTVYMAGEKGRSTAGAERIMGHYSESVEDQSNAAKDSESAGFNGEQNRDDDEPGIDDGIPFFGGMGR